MSGNPQDEGAMKRRPSACYTVLVSGALVRLHQLGYGTPKTGEVFLLLSRLGLVREEDQDARAACSIAYDSDTVRNLQRMLAGE
jgi:hypothetical protein